MSFEQPLVSVLMTAFNREKYIGAAIESVLASTFKDFELLIVDDKSTDDTLSIARAFEKTDPRVKVHVNAHNLGDYPNRNYAASLAIGKYIKFLDADDLIYPYGLEAMAGAMEQFPEAGFGLASIPDPKIPYPAILSPRESYLEHFFGFGHFDRAPGSSIINREAFLKLGGFSGKRMIGDYEFWFKIGREHPMVKFPMYLYWSRRHGEQESFTSYARQYPKLKAAVLKESLQKELPLSESDLSNIKKAIRKQGIKKVYLNALSLLKRIV